MKKKQFGFSLIELLIVVAIILIIAAIAIPNLISARMSANEASAKRAYHPVGGDVLRNYLSERGLFNHSNAAQRSQQQRMLRHFDASLPDRQCSSEW
jgi:prepilin-type N-terminal cleavage/methylation domain-containing protein